MERQIAATVQVTICRWRSDSLLVEARLLPSFLSSPFAQCDIFALHLISCCAASQFAFVVVLLGVSRMDCGNRAGLQPPTEVAKDVQAWLLSSVLHCSCEGHPPTYHTGIQWAHAVSTSIYRARLKHVFFNGDCCCFCGIGFRCRPT